MTDGRADPRSGADAAGDLSRADEAAPTPPAAPGDGPEPAGQAGLSVRQRWAVAGGALAAVLAAAVLSAIVAHGPGAGWPWETTVVRDATGMWDAIGVPARVVMQLGTFGGVVVVTLATGLLATRARWDQPWLAAVAVMAGGLLGLIASNRLKGLVERGRPVGVRLREAQMGFGYTSTHTATAFGMALVLVFLLPRRWQWVPLALAVVVGLARLHVGVHFPLDVVGGALVGTAAGLAVVAAVNPSRGRSGAAP